MTRVEETYAGDTLLSTEPPPFDMTRHPEKVEPSSRTLKRPFVVGIVILEVVLLTGIFGGLQTALAQETPPPTIKTVEPTVIQPDGIVKLTFDKKITATSVKVGNTEAQIVSPTATGESIEVKVAANTPLGQAGINVTATVVKEAPKTTPGQPNNGATTTESVAVTLTSSIIVAPSVLGLRANKNADIELSRGAVAGGEIIIQFLGNIPSEIKQGLKVTIGETLAKIKDIENDYLLVEVPSVKTLKPGYQESYAVVVSVNNKNLDKQPSLRVVRVQSMYQWASGSLLVLIAFIYLIYFFFYKVPEGQIRYSFGKMLLLEQENQTYSLSRAQFLGWLTVIIWTYFFLYFAHGLIEQDWGFPSIGDAVYAFMISLGTLVVAQGANSGVGVKGAGVVNPSPADLVVHGGVLALDRVQQVVWTLVTLGMFVYNTVTKYDTATELPAIPAELLVLMGLSSAGYLGGKLVRGAGPIIEQVTVRAGSVIINIKGKQFSKEAFIWLDGVKQLKDKVTVVAEDPDNPLKYAKELEFQLEISMDDWQAKDHAITVINDDSQRADWRTEPAILEVTHGAAIEKDKESLKIKGAHLAKGATIKITGDDNAKAVQDTSNPNLFTADVDKEWVKTPHELIVTSNRNKASYTFNPSTSQSSGDDQGGDE